MSDVVVLDEGATRYEIHGLRAKGEALTSWSNRLRDQLDDRAGAATDVLADFEGDAAHAFHDQCRQVHGALAVACQMVTEAASICLHFPSRGPAPYPDVPPLPHVSYFSTFAANPLTLQAFAGATAPWDQEVLLADGNVNLDGVTATVSYQREELVPGEVPRVVWTTPQPYDPASLVSLPTLGTIVPRLLTLSEAAGTLAFLTAVAVLDADAFEALPPGVARLLDALGVRSGHDRLTSFVMALRDSHGLPSELHQRHLQGYWLARSLERSGIDMDEWDPSQGTAHNADTIVAVYDYYADLYLTHPHLQWAGMANMIGPSFAAGFHDLRLLREIVQALDNKPDGVPDELWRLANPHLHVLGPLASLTDEEALFYESTFLQMQQDIYVDAAVMHEAYLGGGMPAIRELGQAGIIRSEDVQAWNLIDRGNRNGDAAAIAEGNRRLLEREQLVVIDRYYHQMREHSPGGEAITYAITVVGEPSIPDAPTFAEYRPVTLTYTQIALGWGMGQTPWGTPMLTRVPTAVAEFELSTPLPDGNLANTDDRWDYISDEILPSYEQLLRDDPARVREIVSTPFEERMDHYRLHHRIGSITADLATNWDLEIRSPS